ncbi:uncharacterized protein LOC106660975 isoform X2 [Cimex lectularius]|uniref:Uncharacterized protein n=1 Tax=Cimex lectularius TaxID=79782 RepID=A0A8I6RAJ8_CIMLE|nr:uncharacterized protein LOC106660975 isoform X2 [Cimex lectularius]
MIRLGSLVLIFAVWILLIALVLGDESGGTIKNVDHFLDSVNQDAKIHPAGLEKLNQNFKAGDGLDEGTPQIEVQRGNDDNSYFVSFEEVRESSRNSSNVLTEDETRKARKELMKPYHEKFLAEMKALRDKLYANRSRRQGQLVKGVSDSENELSFEQGVNQYALQAENIVTDIYRTANSIRKQLGVGRNEVPSKFVNTGEANKTQTAIDEILSDLKYQLRKTMGCRGCYNPHPELSEYLEWLVLDNSCKLCATKSKTKDNFRFFHRRLKKPIPCTRKLAEQSLKKPVSRNYEAAKSVLEDYINEQHFRIQD